MDYKKILEHTLITSWKDRSTLKLSLAYFVALSLQAITLLSVLYFATWETITPYLANPQLLLSPSTLPALLSLFITALAIFVVFFIISLIINLFFSVQFSSRALQGLKLSVIPLPLSAYFNYFVIGLGAALFSLIPIFIPLHLIAPVLIAMFFILALLIPSLSIVFILLIAITLFPYFFIVLYHTFRLSFSGEVFLNQGNGIMDSLRTSWKLTEGKLIPIFITWLMLIAVAIVLAIVLFVLFWIPETILGLNASLAIQNIIQNPALLSSNLNLLAASYALSLVREFIFAVIGLVITVYGWMAVYAQLLPAKSKLAVKNKVNPPASKISSSKKKA